MDYNGGRTKDTIIEWINKKTGPVSLEVDCAGMEAKTGEASLSISYFGAQEGDLWDNYMNAARNPAISEKFSFFHTSDGDCASKFGTSAPGIGLSRRFDESPLGYTGGASEDEIIEFAKKASVPRLITFSEDFIEPIFGPRSAIGSPGPTKATASSPGPARPWLITSSNWDSAESSCATRGTQQSRYPLAP